jgi:hypothetical protein
MSACTSVHVYHPDAEKRTYYSWVNEPRSKEVYFSDEYQTAARSIFGPEIPREGAYGNQVFLCSNAVPPEGTLSAPELVEYRLKLMKAGAQKGVVANLCYIRRFKDFAFDNGRPLGRADIDLLTPKIGLGHNPSWTCTQGIIVDVECYTNSVQAIGSTVD